MVGIAQRPAEIDDRVATRSWPVRMSCTRFSLGAARKDSLPMPWRGEPR
jgi:hypothetical protein